MIWQHFLTTDEHFFNICVLSFANKKLHYNRAGQQFFNAPCKNVTSSLQSFIFSDEAHFDLAGYINKQNCRIWATENPYAYIAKPTHPKRVTVWCKKWTRDIIGPFCFENEQEEAITVNGDSYRAMLNEFLFTKPEEEDIGNIWFQQDGDTCQTAETTLNILCPVFEDCIISCRADVVWPPQSCDLTPLDCYL